jgi:solute carrier family 25 phosphate transporter 23/24/25/41
MKKSLPEKYQKRTEASLLIAVVSASLATLTCYPLDTVRRQMQMRGTPYNTVLDAFPGKLLSLCSPVKELYDRILYQH